MSSIARHVMHAAVMLSEDIEMAEFVYDIGAHSGCCVAAKNVLRVDKRDDDAAASIVRKYAKNVIVYIIDRQRNRCY